MILDSFFAQHPVFRLEELVDYLNGIKTYNPNSLKALLQYHLSKKHIARIRGGYYLVLESKAQLSIGNNSILIAGRVKKDAVVAYHTALEFHALSYTIFHVAYFCAFRPMGIINSNYGSYQRVAHPKALQPNDIFVETKIYDRQGLDIRVTTIERTLVDCLNKPHLGGGWEEIWQSFSTLNFLDLEHVIEYALRLGNATTISKLGFFLEQHKQQFSVKEEYLNTLEKYKPKSKHYMEYGKKLPVQYLKRWNIIVPLTIINKTWEEPTDDSI